LLLIFIKFYQAARWPVLAILGALPRDSLEAANTLKLAD